MIVIKPELITETELITTNVPETDAPAWNSATNYVTGNQVIYQHRIYEALRATVNDIPNVSPLDWLDSGATNRYRVFDKIVGNLTSNTGTIQYTLRIGSVISAISFFNVTGSSIRVQVDDPDDGVVYDRTISLIDLSTISSYYAYFFDAVGEPRKEVTLLDLPNYPLADIIITISNGVEVCRCGEIVLGAQKKLGYTNYGTSVGIRDYSKKETDEFGFTTIVERKFAKTADYDCSFENSELAGIQRYLSAIRATPVVWIGNIDAEETIVYGYYKNFRLVISAFTHSDGTIEVEGLT